jgi:hypothetical protein
MTVKVKIQGEDFFEEVKKLKPEQYFDKNLEIFSESEWKNPSDFSALEEHEKNKKFLHQFFSFFIK